jgi:hypothetical protein
MTKTCDNCGNATLDDQAQFCNRCGASVPDKPKTPYPVCPACGAVVSDTQAQFCNRCGTKIPPAPIVCGTCGIPAVDDQSRFCTRCGSMYQPKAVPRSTSCPVCGAPDPGNNSVFCNRCGAPLGRPDTQPFREDPAAVIISPKRASPAMPDGAAAISGEHLNRDTGITLSQKPPVSYRQAGETSDFQAGISPRRYGHLPLIADELKGKETPVLMQPDQDTPASAGKSVKKQKKGVLGFLKK